MYTIIVDNLEEQCIDIDQAMNLCFEIFPDADFNGWHENDSESWLDIISENTTVGKIFER